MIVKVCGMRDADNIREVEKLFTIHFLPFTFYMGFIFWPKSSRYVSERPAYLPTKCKRVGVFVDADLEEVKQKVEEYALDVVQLHGHETPDYIRILRAEAASPAVIKAFNIATAADLKTTKPYEGIVDYFLFDAKGKSVGGNGEKFDWSILADYTGETTFLLSGGIGPDDTEIVNSLHIATRSKRELSTVNSKCIGIDLNSRFETAPALKDVAALRRFLSQLSHSFQNSHNNYE